MMLKRCLLIILFYATSTILAADEYPDLSKEDKLKAAYLFNFTKFITWPKEQSTKQSITLCLHASDAINGFLKELVKGRKVQNRYQVVVRDIGTTKNCDMIYVSQQPESHKIDFSDSLVVLSHKDLNVPDGAIRFFVENTRLRFEVDLVQVNRLKLSISSELLKLATLRND